MELPLSLLGLLDLYTRYPVGFWNCCWSTVGVLVAGPELCVPSLCHGNGNAFFTSMSPPCWRFHGFSYLLLECLLLECLWLDGRCPVLFLCHGNRNACFVYPLLVVLLDFFWTVGGLNHTTCKYPVSRPWESCSLCYSSLFLWTSCWTILGSWLLKPGRIPKFPTLLLGSVA